MTCSIKVLTTAGLDSSPSLLLISPNGNKTLVNCGEGCQRSFLESTGLRVKSVTRVCLTHIAHGSVGGLPGMVLTTADVREAAIMNANNGGAKKSSSQAEASSNSNAGANNTSPRPPSKRKASTPLQNLNHDEDMPGLDIYGPSGTQQFLNSLRHFMRRDRFQLRVHEGEYKQTAANPKSSPRAKGKKRGRKEDTTEAEGFHVGTIPCMHKLNENKNEKQSETRDNEHDSVQVLSFIFTTPPIPGKFLPSCAKELGIPPGPLFGQLKSGKSVTFKHPTTQQDTTVESHQVVTQGSPGVAVAVLYCPSLQVLQQLKESAVIEKLLDVGEANDDKKEQPELEAVVHMAPADILDSDEYRAWVNSFPQSVEHIRMESPNCLAQQPSLFESDNGSPFHSAALGAMSRSLLRETLFPSPVMLDDINDAQGDTNGGGDNKKDPDFKFSMAHAWPMMEYILIPRSKRGFTETVPTRTIHGISEQEIAEVKKSVLESGALNLAKQLCEANGSTGDCSMAELVFTGTGSAIPCKHRNVTGMYLRMSNGKGMLLDVGEGTTGQLLRSKARHIKDVSSAQELIQSIKAVWISHPHADHHVGLLRFLTERNAICGQGVDPVVLMAPPNLFRFLDEYSRADSRIRGSYIPLDCRDMVAEKRNPLGDKLYSDLGITYCVSIPVAHCPHSFAVVVDGATGFGRVAYSGDCRPSTRFANVGVNADLLIHEATFEDGMEQEAVVKRHCTVGEALGVGRHMKAKAVVLTHFSQRYPRIPPLKTNGENNGAETTTNGLLALEQEQQDSEMAVVFAFDFMTLTPGNVTVASKLTPSLRLLYPGDRDAEESSSAVASAMDTEEPLEEPPANE